MSKLFLILNSFSSRISGQPDIRQMKPDIQLNINRIPNRIPDITKIGYPVSRITGTTLIRYKFRALIMESLHSKLWQLDMRL